MLLLLSIHLAFLLGGKDPSCPSGAPQRAEEAVVRSVHSNGLEIEFRVEPAATDALRCGEDARVAIEVRDALSGEPIRGLHPLAWIDARKGREAPNEEVAQDRVAAYLGGILSLQADLDLNGWWVWVLNHDGTISVIDPLVNFSRSKLEAIVELPAPGSDLVFTENQDLLFVTVPEADQVVAIDSRTRRIVRHVEFDAGSRPLRLLRGPQETVWVAFDGVGGLARLEARLDSDPRLILLGRGPLDPILVEAGAPSIAALDAEGLELFIVDPDSGEVEFRKKLPGRPTGAVWGAAARRLFVAAVEPRVLLAIDPEEEGIVRTLEAPGEFSSLACDPEGRYLFAAEPSDDRVWILDTATSRWLEPVSVVPRPDRIEFSEKYAYVRGLGSAAVTLIELGGLRERRATPLEIVAGKLPPAARPEDIGPAPMVVPTPEVGSVMIANGPDMTLYYYVEGMLAPMGSFRNYKRRPRGIAILDKSLLEVEPGTYATSVRFPEPGLQDAFLVLDQPRVLEHFEFQVLPGRESGRAVVQVEFDRDELSLTDGEPCSVEFRVIDAASGKAVEGLRDATVSLVHQAGLGYQHVVSVERDPGHYEARFPALRPGLYYGVVTIETRDVGEGAFAPVIVRVLPSASEEDPR